MSSSAIAEKPVPEPKTDEVKPERVPKDTAAELERIKQLVGAHLGVDTRSPGQVAQAEEDAEQAQKELEAQQKKEAKEAEEAEEKAQAEQKALTSGTGASRSTK